MSILQGNFKREIRLSFNPELEEQVEKEENERRRSSGGQTEINVEEPFMPSPECIDKMAEEERLDFLLRGKHNLTEYYENMAYVPPHGMTAHDYKSVAAPRREGLEKFKMQTRRENYIYLAQHPDVDAMIEIVLKKLMKEQPADPVKYMAEYFCVKQSKLDEHKREIKEERARIARHRKAKSKEFEFPSVDISASVRKLNLGPFADILEFTSTKEPEPDAVPKSESMTEQAEEVTPAPHVYCGCKDWKKNRKLQKGDSSEQKKWSVQSELPRVSTGESQQLEADESEMEEYVEYDSNEEEPEEQLQAPTVRPTKISFAESRAKVSAVQSQKLSTSPSASKDEANNE